MQTRMVRNPPHPPTVRVTFEHSLYSLGKHESSATTVAALLAMAQDNNTQPVHSRGVVSSSWPSKCTGCKHKRSHRFDGDRPRPVKNGQHGWIHHLLTRPSLAWCSTRGRTQT
jgi:hypothetical protein